jgi:hypothetical protein
MDSKIAVVMSVGRCRSSATQLLLNKADFIMNVEMEIPPASQSAAYKDRSVWLTIFGVLTILLGGICLLFIPLMIFGAIAAHAEGGIPGLFPEMGMYGAAGGGLVWCGIGSILARRWARALLLIFSWSWLAIGVIAIACVAIFLPAVIKAQPHNPNTSSQAVEYGVLAITGVILLFTFIVIPAIWALFYGRKSVKATCEARNPLPSWTDACPLPVLAMSLLLGLSVLSYVGNILSYRIIPFFGVFLTGTPAVLIYIILIAVCVITALGLYRMDRRAWWLVLLMMTLIFLSSGITYWFHSLREFYHLMGYSEQQIRAMQNAAFDGRRTVWMTLVFALPMVGYVLFIGRYFKRAKGDLPASEER